MTHIAVSDKGGAQLTPGVEHRLVDRVAVGAELYGQGIQGNGVDHDRDEYLTLPGDSSVSTARRSAASRSRHSGSRAGSKPNRSGSLSQSSASSGTPGSARSAARSCPTSRG